MRKRFWKITSVAAAISIALALGVNSAFADSADSGNESAIVVIDEETMAKANAYAEAYEKAYDEALQEEMANIEADMEKFCSDFINGNGIEVVEDPHVVARKNAEKIATEKCEALGLQREILELQPLVNAPYTGWRGSFPVPDFNGYSYPFFDPPYYCRCTAGGSLATIKGTTGYETSYKSVSVTVTYADGTTASNSNKGVSPTISVTVPNEKTIVSAHYMFALFDNSDPRSQYKEVVFINYTLADN